jgi:transcription-repair coupling factor (superfamily II helicase)
MFTTGFDPSKAGRVTIAGSPSGHDVRVLAELAQRAHGTSSAPVIHVALDDMRAAVMADALAFFAPDCEALSLPAWDCLPYDRISPHADIVGARLSALSRMQEPFTRPAVILTTVNALVQKTLPPEALKHASLDVAIGNELPVEKLRQFLATNGYVNASTVREPGEFAVRGGIVDLFPPGYENPIRLDYFGDEIETIRVFDALSQVTTDKIDRFRLGPISEVLLDERAIAQFRSGYRELFGAVTESDPLYEAVTEGRKFPGVEHWLGLFYPRLYGLLDYVPNGAVIFDPQADEAIKARLAQIEDFYQARLGLYQAARRGKDKKQTPAAVYKPAPVDRLYLTHGDLDKALGTCAVGLLSPFAPPDGTALDARGQRGRDFADARAKQEEIPALQSYIAEQQKAGRRVAIACYSNGSAERLSGLLRAHHMPPPVAIRNAGEGHKLDPKIVTLVLLGFEHGFTSPDLALVTEQDILGDRLVRPARSIRAILSSMPSTASGVMRGSRPSWFSAPRMIA